MSAYPAGPEWWGEPERLVVPPTSAYAFVRVLQQQLAEDEGREGPDALDDSYTGLCLHHLLPALTRRAPELSQRAYLEFLRCNAESVARRLGPTPPWGSPNPALEPAFREVLNAMMWHAAALPSALHLDVASGFLPMPLFTEVVLPVPGSEAGYVLGLTHEVMTFANLLGKAWAQVLPMASDGQSQRLDLDRPGWLSGATLDAPGVQRFLDVMLAARAGRPSFAQQYWPRGAWVPLAEFIRDAMEYFIVGRGVAHVVLGHVRMAPVRTISMSGRPVRAFRFSQQQERDADEQSLGWLLTLDRFADGPAVAGWAVCLYMSCGLMLDEWARYPGDAQEIDPSEARLGASDGIGRLRNVQDAMLRMGRGGEAALRLHRELSGLFEIMAGHVFSVIERDE